MSVAILNHIGLFLTESGYGPSLLFSINVAVLALLVYCEEIKSYFEYNAWTQKIHLVS